MFILARKPSKWWADPVAGLGLIPFWVKEGCEGVMGEDDDGTALNAAIRWLGS